MGEIEEFLRMYSVEALMIIAGIIVLLLIINIIILAKTSKMKKNYKTLLNGRENVNIEGLLTGTAVDINALREEINGNKEIINGIETKMAFSIQKVGFVRYNAFAEMGSDLSFSIAMLDSFQNGFVLSSIYGRDQASVYAKPIKAGKSTYPLSVEEIQAIDRANLGQGGEKLI